ncbi:hypothetical protein B0J14DRAFT_169503 [Halenospora varia]|nr:hypothetical protein B0J14DRAFT_169503 [Halenospora varia]
MSFGWSAGDIVTAIALTNKVISSVRSVGGSREHFQELESELAGLLRALNDIHAISGQPGQVHEIVALKFAACLCEDTIRRFHDKIKPFEGSLGVGSQASRLRAAPRMVRWKILTKKDIPEFRSYLVAHVGSLNLRLSTASLKLSSQLYSESRESHREHETSIENIRKQLSTQTLSICEKISLIPDRDTVPTLQSLLAMATNVWKTQTEMMETFMKALDRLPPPDLHHTWAQAPIRFEDALGRVIPVPSEYDWDMFEAIIHTRFKDGPGHTKVRSQEYELFFFGVNVTPIRAAGYRPTPGMWITMTFIVGQYAGSQRCPRLGCTSREFAFLSGGAKKCSQCQGWFLLSGQSLPRPLKPPAAWKEDETPCNERKFFKNISLYLRDLPPTPMKFRDKYHRQRVNPRFAAAQRSLLQKLPADSPLEQGHQGAMDLQAFASIQAVPGKPPLMQPQSRFSYWGLPPQLQAGSPGPLTIPQTCQMGYVQPAFSMKLHPQSANVTPSMGSNPQPSMNLHANYQVNSHDALAAYTYGRRHQAQTYQTYQPQTHQPQTYQPRRNQHQAYQAYQHHAYWPYQPPENLPPNEYPAVYDGRYERSPFLRRGWNSPHPSH